MMVYNFDLSIVMPEGNLGLKPLWSWELPKLIANDVMMFSGIILAIIFSKLLPEQVVKLASKIETIISIILTGMASTIPFFVAGFVVKLQHDNVMMVIIKDYYLIFAVIALAQFSYISLIYLFLNKMELKSYIANIKNMLPAAIVGFSTMSSISSLPLTIIGAEKNAKNKYLARMVIPATASIHLIGDCFAIPIFAYAVLKSFGIAEPSLINYMIFAFYFVLAKFSVAAVPGGGILVMLPILEKYLGFNADMMSLITALYILFDPVITCANILGNGAFAKIIEHCISLLEYKGKKSIRRSA
jgi:Na+/H+-dicarboxylate symporter